MSYNPDVKPNILEKLRAHTEELYTAPKYPIFKQELGIIRIVPGALRTMADNLIARGFGEDEIVEVEGVIADLDNRENIDVFCYHIPNDEEEETNG